MPRLDRALGCAWTSQRMPKDPSTELPDATAPCLPFCPHRARRACRASPKPPLTPSRSLVHSLTKPSRAPGHRRRHPTSLPLPLRAPARGRAAALEPFRRRSPEGGDDVSAKGERGVQRDGDGLDNPTGRDETEAVLADMESIIHRHLPVPSTPART
ncbi:hypothetical protein CDD83_1049 [Cordyceps sp. RAO-2017]|nr:hypothetical protein CDD83_1049 [Cordyceps sp. RAO-2017]